MPYGSSDFGDPGFGETVLILDFGSQYTQLIARRVRECNVYSEIVPHSITSEDVKARNPRGIILSGGPASVYEEGAPDCDRRLFELGIPVLGICYGMQYMARALGGNVARGRASEYGKTVAIIDDRTDLFKGLKLPEVDKSLIVWMSHGDLVEVPPEGFEAIAHTKTSPVAAMRDKQRKFYGVQFHPEVVHTDQGIQIIRNFVRGICGCAGTWTMESFLQAAVEEVRRKVGGKKAVCALSGGIDSSVAAALVYRAIGEQLTCVFVDHGFMRQGEPEQVDATFRQMFRDNFVHVDSSDRFLDAIKGISDPERKRKIIGESFIRVFEEQASKLGDIDFLVQGTTYPDVIESGGGVAETIKSHHNVGGLPEQMQLELLEPLKYLFKDEVRLLAAELGLPDEVIWRQPFPGPGLAIRIMGDVTREKLEIIRKADHIVVEEIRNAGLYKEIWQSFAVLSNTRTVGVMGDRRTYSYLVGVRAVTSQDGMTADWAKLPLDLLEKISNRILNEVDDVNRVVYDISSKPPSTIEWE